MYGGAKGRRPPGLRERRHSGLRPGIAGADTICQPLARLRAGAGMPPFHTYFAGREASPLGSAPYSCGHKKAVPEGDPAQALIGYFGIIAYLTITLWVRRPTVTM